MAKNSIPYFTFYPADFMGGVRGMTPQEIGVYTMLLCRMYEESGPVEYHVLRLSTYCGMREKTFVAVAEKLIALGKITMRDGMIFNDRASIEIADRSDKLKNNSKAGKASAEKRQQNQCETPTGVKQPFNHTDTDTDTDKKKSNTFVSPKAQPKNGSRLPFEECPTEWTIFGSEVMSWDGAHIAATFSKFHDYWVAQPGVKGRKTDWLATWRNWCRDERPQKNGSLFPAKKDFVSDVTEVMQRRLSRGESPL